MPKHEQQKQKKFSNPPEVTSREKREELNVDGSSTLPKNAEEKISNTTQRMPGTSFSNSSKDFRVTTKTTTQKTSETNTDESPPPIKKMPTSFSSTITPCSTRQQVVTQQSSKKSNNTQFPQNLVPSPPLMKSTEPSRK